MRMCDPAMTANAARLGLNSINGREYVNPCIIAHSQEPAQQQKQRAHTVANARAILKPIAEGIERLRHAGTSAPVPRSAVIRRYGNGAP